LLGIVLGVIWNLGKSRPAKHSKGLIQEGELTKVDICGYWGAGASKNENFSTPMALTTALLYGIVWEMFFIFSMKYAMYPILLALV